MKICDKDEQVTHRIYADKVFFVDQNFFEVFSYKLLIGDKANVLRKPNTMLISEQHAFRIFGEDWATQETLIGTVLKSGRDNLNVEAFVIEGVFQKPPANSHLQFDMIASVTSPVSGLALIDNGPRKNLYTYVKTKPKTRLDQNALNQYDHSDLEGNKFSVDVRMVSKIHLSETMANQPELGANKEMISFLIAIGIIIFVMVWTNYINSSLITSIYRIKEIGIRKLLGIKPPQLIFTFLSESFLINLFAGFIAVLLIIFSLKALEVFPYIDYPTDFARSTFGTSLLFLFFLCVLSSVVSGTYPALLMSKMQPVESLRGSLQVAQSKYSNKGSKVIRGLLIMQLGIVLIFVSAVYTVHKQLSYLENNNFSLTELKVEGIFPGIIGADDDFNRRFLKLRNDMTEEGTITEMTLSNLYRGQLKNTYLASPLSKPEMDSALMYQGTIHLYIVDYEYFKKDSASFLAGNNFSPLFSSDYGHIIINESAMHAIGYASPEEAVGQLADDVNGFKTITGIIRNKLDNEPPKMFKTGLRFSTYFNITMQIRGTSGTKIQSGLNRLERRLSFQFPYLYLLDEQYEDMYKSENEILNFFVSSNIVALLIAGIGLYSLSSFTTIKRNQEIGIRKVLGAKTFDILLILYYDFGILMMYGGLIAAPLIIWGSKSWLSTYNYNIGVDFTILVLPLIATILFIASIVSARCWKSANQNPVVTLTRS